ncbi:HalD/BesD family halogenase [Cystobacter fuscus]
MQQEVFRLRECAFRRQFNMECMNNSPRRMSTLGGDGIQELSTLVPLLYGHPALLRFLSYVVDVEVETLPDIDRYVVNDLHQSGDTFGAHYDDYPISLVFIIEGAPPEAEGTWRW